MRVEQDRTGEPCLRPIQPMVRCVLPLRRGVDVERYGVAWMCEAGHYWSPTMQTVHVKRMLAPRDTWPLIRLTLLPLPWTWPLRPWWYGERWGTLSIRWLCFEVHMMAQEHPGDWFHEIYNPLGDYWKD